VVHLAGEPVGERWTESRKRKIRESRVRGTETLVRAICALPQPPTVLVSASGVGYYGDRGDEQLVEGSPPGNDFLAEVTQAWEAAVEPAGSAGVRVVPLRFGVVIAREGGALERLLTPFRLGVGGQLGTGRQWMSWDLPYRRSPRDSLRAGSAGASGCRQRRRAATGYECGIHPRARFGSWPPHAPDCSGDRPATRVRGDGGSHAAGEPAGSSAAPRGRRVPLRASAHRRRSSRGTRFIASGNR
jgi:hypothetical protein